MGPLSEMWFTIEKATQCKSGSVEFNLAEFKVFKGQLHRKHIEAKKTKA